MDQELYTKLRGQVAHGSVDDIERILSSSNCKDFLPQLFRNTIGNSRDNVLDLLIQHTDVDELNCGLNAAIDYRRADLIERLLPISRPKTQRSEILTRAVCSQNLEAVRILVNYCNPLAGHSSALQACYDIGDPDLCNTMVEILYPVSSPKQALKYLYPTSSAWADLWQRIETERLQSVLRSEIKKYGTAPIKRKM